MIGSQAVSQIQRVLGFRSDRAAEILEELQLAQVRLEEGVGAPEGAQGQSLMGDFLPWFLETEISSIFTVAGEERVPIPTDFLDEVEQDALWYFTPATGSDPEKWTALKKDDIDFLRGRFPGSGPPQAYAFQAQYFRIFPLPDAAYKLKMIYFKKDAVITLGTENKWLANQPFIVIAEAGYHMAMSLRDAGAMKFFKDLGESEAACLYSSELALEHTNRSYVMGGED